MKKVLMLVLALLFVGAFQLSAKTEKKEKSPFDTYIKMVTKQKARMDKLDAKKDKNKIISYGKKINKLIEKAKKKSDLLTKELEKNIANFTKKIEKSTDDAMKEKMKQKKELLEAKLEQMKEWTKEIPEAVDVPEKKKK